MGNEICLIKKFFQISSFVFSRTNKHIEGFALSFLGEPFNSQCCTLTIITLHELDKQSSLLVLQIHLKG